MTTLADLVTGDAFILLARVTAQDQVTGDTLTYYGPGGQPQGTMTISPAGVFAGQLAAPAAQVPVQRVPVFAAVSPGDVLQNTVSGETMAVRQVKIMADGTYQWAASPAGRVWYTLDAWTVIAHVGGL